MSRRPVNIPFFDNYTHTTGTGFYGLKYIKYIIQYNILNVMYVSEESTPPQEQPFNPAFHFDTGLDPPGRVIAVFE